MLDRLRTLRGMRAIRSGLNNAVDIGLIKHVGDEQLTNNWRYHIYRAEPPVSVRVNRENIQGVSQISYGEPCGNLLIASYLWLAAHVTKFEIEKGSK